MPGRRPNSPGPTVIASRVGLIQCSDCHNPHGTQVGHQVRAAAGQFAVCTKCHTDTMGPFVFEHAPVKTEEGCLSCHTPHGSTNPRLLQVNNVNFLCLRCHTPNMNGAAPVRRRSTTSPQSIRHAPCAIRKSMVPTSVRCSSVSARLPWLVKGFALIILDWHLIADCCSAGHGFAQNAGHTRSHSSDCRLDRRIAGEGKEIGGFQVTQSIEFGGRISDVSGSQPMYDTLVNEQSRRRASSSSR